MKKLLLLSFLAASAATSNRFLARAAPENPRILPIFDLKSGYLLGGTGGGKWVKPQATARGLKSGAAYSVYSPTRRLGTAQMTAPKSEGAPCPDTLFSKASLDFSPKGAELALGGAQNPLPRIPQVENTNQATYRRVVAAILRGRGIAQPVVQITQIWRVDLDGDGKQEVLLTATRKADGGAPRSIQPNARAGDYSLVLLRKIVGKTVKNILLESEFYPRAKTFNAPGFYRIAAVFDANGDGKMEVLIRGQYYEGIWTNLHEIRREKTQTVLSEGCGA